MSFSDKWQRHAITVVLKDGTVLQQCDVYRRIVGGKPTATLWRQGAKVGRV